MKKKSLKTKSKSKVSKSKSKKKVSKRNPIKEKYSYSHPKNVSHFIEGYYPSRMKGYEYPELESRIATLKEAKEILKQYGWSIIKNEHNEYESYPINDYDSNWKCQSGDLTDAVMSGISNARRMTNELLRRKQYKY